MTLSGPMPTTWKLVPSWQVSRSCWYSPRSDSPTVMCSESLWWRCHRRLLADHLVLVRGIDVVHLMHDGRSTPHVPTEGVRLADDTLVYDVGVTPPLSVT